MDGGAVVAPLALEAAVAQHLFRLRQDSILQTVLTMSHCLVHDNFVIATKQTLRDATF